MFYFLFLVGQIEPFKTYKSLTVSMNITDLC